MSSRQFMGLVEIFQRVKSPSVDVYWVGSVGLMARVP
jgi:hypothetical protein